MTGVARGTRQRLCGLWLAFGCALAGCGGNARGSAIEAAGGTSTQTGIDPNYDDDDLPDSCDVQPLSEACPETVQCPTEPDDVGLFCNGTTQTTRSATDCGGTMVDVNNGLGGDAWYFDADGKLVGLRSTSDIIGDCDDPVTTYGEVCDTVGEAEDLCLAACANQPPLTDDGAVLTEADYDFASLCTGKNARQITQAATICGGQLYVVRLDDGFTENYCFDEAGRLIGRSREDPEGEIAEQLGTACLPDGYLVPQCGVNPG